MSYSRFAMNQKNNNKKTQNAPKIKGFLVKGDIAFVYNLFQHNFFMFIFADRIYKKILPDNCENKLHQTEMFIACIET